MRIGDHVIQREVTIGGGHGGGQVGWIHFGLGPARGAEIRVIWPDGETGSWLQVGANQLVTISRRAEEAEVWNPPEG
jgi:hypothetical protein